MANNQQLLLGEGAGGGIPNYIEEVFNTFVWTGTGSNQTLTTGVDTATHGGLFWTKNRTNVFDHALWSTNFSLAGNYLLKSNTTGALTYGTYGTGDYASNSTTGVTVYGNSQNYVTWTFRKQKKFFDVVTYTGNGSTFQTVSHGLGSEPGCIIAKRTDTTENWVVYHRALAGDTLRLNLTDAKTGLGGAMLPSSTNVDFYGSGGSDPLNASGGTYVAYLFAHDAGGFGLTGLDNVISCGSYTRPASGTVNVNLNWEPQFILLKEYDNTTNWEMFDIMRGLTNSNGIGKKLNPNSSAAEADSGAPLITSTGWTQTGFGVAQNFIYIAIRRGPMKVPTVGTSVFSPTAPANGTGAATSISGLNFSPDLMINLGLSSGIGDSAFDRLRGRYLQLLTDETGAEVSRTDTVTGFDIQNGVLIGTGSSGYVNNASYSYNNLLFRRAPSFFDVVCWTGTNADQTLTHNLTVAPELIIYKVRGTGGYNWEVSSNFAASNYVKTILNLTNASSTLTYVGGGSISAQPTATQFSVGQYYNPASTMVAYLFATCAGVSKVGSYTGNGSSQTIACGFTAGSRFVMIKRTDSTGDWYVWDSARGIVAGNDPHLSLNTTAAEVTTDDSVDTDNSGFIVNQDAATNVNVSSATYIFLAIS